MPIIPFGSASKKVHYRSLRSADGRSLATPLINLRTVGDRSLSSVGPRLLNSLPLSIRDGSQTGANADPGNSFSAVIRSYLKAAYYSGLLSASRILKTVALVWNVGYPMRTESPSGYVKAIEISLA